MDRWADDSTGGESLREATENMWIDYSDGREDAAITMFGVVQDKLASAGQRVLLCLRELWKDEVDFVTAPDQFEKPSATLDGKSSSGKTDGGVGGVGRVDLCALYQARPGSNPDSNGHSRDVICVTGLDRDFLSVHQSARSYDRVIRATGVLAAVVITTYALINRDPILSRTINEKPGRLDMDFLWKTASMVGIPVLGLIASQFPEVSSFLFSWIEPGLNASK